MYNIQVRSSACMAAGIIAGTELGLRFLLHGRDMDVVHNTVSLLAGKAISNGQVGYLMTSRYWLHSGCPQYARYLQAGNDGQPRIHVDTGFEGTAPMALADRGFDVQAIWLYGAKAGFEHRLAPLPLKATAMERFDSAYVAEKAPHSHSKPAGCVQWDQWLAQTPSQEYLEYADDVRWRTAKILRDRKGVFVRAVERWLAAR
jgi:hypothetical protein